MGKQLTDLTFEQWLHFTFDHPAGDLNQAWYWDIDRDWWDENAADSVRFMIEAFENSGEVFKPFTDAQVNQGLWYIASNACSNHMFGLTDPKIPWAARQRCVRSIHQLYEHCFAKKCTPHLSHIDEPGASPLNLVCYMWWDIIPIAGQPQDLAQAELDPEILAVMESTLQIDSIACRESALHGLGHWQHQYPERVAEIINKFSMDYPYIPKALQEYMKNAYVGYVL